MADCLKSDSPDDYRIQVSQWEPFIVDKKPEMQEEEATEEHSQQTTRQRFYTFGSFHADNCSSNDPFEADLSVDESPVVPENAKPKLVRLKPSIIGRSVSAIESPKAADGPLLSTVDLWEKDNACRQATRDGFTLSPDSHGYGGRNVTIGLGEAAAGPTHDISQTRHRRAVSFDPGLVNQRLQEELESLVIKDRLHGYVRHHPFHMNSSQEFSAGRRHSITHNPQEFP